MTIQEKLEPLTRWTEADVQQWCRKNPFVPLGGGRLASTCLFATIAKQMTGEEYCYAAFGEVGPAGVTVGGSVGVVAAMDLFDSLVRDPGPMLREITVIEAAALMWPEEFADEAKRLVQSVDAKHAVEVADCV